jgi:type IV pilus assembly protein PilY1
MVHYMCRKKHKRIHRLTWLILLGAVSFSLAGTAWADTVATVTGCAGNVLQEYNGEFKANDFDLVNVSVDENGYLVLNTGDAAIDPNNIVIPFTQEVSVTFLYEGIGYKLSDFGWMLAEKGIGGPKYEVYQNINDNNEDGVLDLSTDDQSAAYGDTNGDGTIDARDNKQVLGTFAGGTELVFYLKVDDEKQTFYSKDEWNPDAYTSSSGECSKDDAGDNFTKTYHLGRPLKVEDVCTLDGNWLAQPAYERIKDLFGLEFSDDDVTTLDIKRDKPFAHVIVSAPGHKPNEWVLGWEDLAGGGDTDHNDLVFQIERETGGVAQLQSNKALVPDEEDAYFTGVTVRNYDRMPCGGKTTVTYYLSIDNGSNWVEITGWDEVYRFTLEKDGNKIFGEKISEWIPGSPEFTYRTSRVDFAGRGLSGSQLIWKAEFTSQAENCEPRLIGLSLDASVATHDVFSRSSPVVIANVIYSGSYETPAPSWTDKEMRGHLVATQLYDPHNPEATETAAVWDAGQKLSQTSPDDRNIKFPDITVHQGSHEVKATGDNTTKTFSGMLSNHPLVATSIIITDQTETFYDNHTDVLEGSLGGTGTINRSTGEFKVTFNTAPDNNQPITASYHYYTTQQQLLDFTTANVTNHMLSLDDTYIIPGGFIYDFNGSGAVDADDGKWLVNWVRGYKDGFRTTKDWLLGPIDHSVPAGATPPGQPAWLFGTAISPAERDSYKNFRNLQAERKTVLYVGARDGMLHAFEAGRFRHGDNRQSNISENRGYFIWEDQSEDCPAYCSNACDECPDYGSGEELWAFIPANLIPRLKNNLRKADDQAYVDASPALADVFIGDEWKTVLLSAEGNGGDAVFCLDVTDPADPNFLWEFADPDLFRSRSSPSVARIGRIVDNAATKWVAFFVSGKADNAALYPSIYMINIADGSMVRRIFLNADAGGLGGIPSGQPAIIDSDGNGYIDRVYIGSDNGRLYKINIPDDPNINLFDINHCVINNDFTADGRDPVDEDQRWHPIYGAPLAVVENALTAEGKISYNTRIFFGTGDSPYYDEDIDTENTRYHFFAYRDQDEKGQCDQNAVQLAWFLELPAGKRIFSSAFAAAGNIYFGTSRAETEDPCAGGGGNQGAVGGGGVYALSMEDGSQIMDDNVGNITTTPLVVDEHLYVKSQSMGLRSYGGGPYNNPTNISGSPQFTMRNWRELF